MASRALPVTSSVALALSHASSLPWQPAHTLALFHTSSLHTSHLSAPTIDLLRNTSQTCTRPALSPHQLCAAGRSFQRCNGGVRTPEVNECYQHSSPKWSSEHQVLEHLICGVTRTLLEHCFSSNHTDDRGSGNWARGRGRACVYARANSFTS